MKSGKVKITSGKFKGRNLKTPKNDVTHPMGARERLALFNMLMSYLDGTVVLDTFAGTGALGLEALSRGADVATFVEKDSVAADAIRQNIHDLGLDNQAKVIEQPVENFQSNQEFDLVLVDPPYMTYGHQTMWIIIRQILPIVKKGGILVLSHPVGHIPVFEGFKLLTSRQYAGANISIFQRQA